MEYLGITEKEMKQIDYHIKSTIDHYGFTSSDYDDLKQELLIHIFNNLQHYKDEKAQRYTFISRICRNRLNTIIEMNNAQKRDYTKTVSGDKIIKSRDGNSKKRLMERLNEDKVESSQRHKLFGYWKDSYRQIDISTAISELSMSDQLLCKMLTEKNKSDVAEQLGIPRTTLDYRIKVLRKKFPKSLKKYI